MNFRQGAAVAAVAVWSVAVVGPAQATPSPASVQALYERVPVIPVTQADAGKVVTAEGKIVGADWVALRRQIAAERKASEAVLAQRVHHQQAEVLGAGGIDYARMQSDPAYAQRMQAEMQKEAARLQSLPPALQMAEAMKMQQRLQQQGMREVQKIAQEPPAVEAATAAVYERNTMLGQDLAQRTVWMKQLDAIRLRVTEQRNTIASAAAKRLRCSDGEGGCMTPADEAHDRALAQETWARIKPLYEAGLRESQAVLADMKRGRAAVVRTGQSHLTATGYGATATSDTNRQLIGQYHTLLLNEVEELLNAAESALKWAGAALQAPDLYGHPVR